MKKRHPSHKTKLDALKRIEGQVRGIQAMVGERRYCVDILTQISAIRAALLRVQKNILETHMQSCVKNAFASKTKKTSRIIFYISIVLYLIGFFFAFLLKYFLSS